MKITKILALVLACIMVVCMFVACDNGDAQGDDATTTPLNNQHHLQAYTIFQIR